MWKKEYSNADEEKQFSESAKAMMADLENKAYDRERVPAWLTLIQSKSASALYIDAKGTPEQVTEIQKIGFVFHNDELPKDVEMVMQTHEE